MTSGEAMSKVIEGADAAAYAYGIIGVHLEGVDERRARRALSAHRRARDVWQQRAPSLVPAPAAFDLIEPVAGEAQARALAITVERRLVALYADLASATTGEDRAQAVSDAMACEGRAVTWGAATQAFPSA